MHEFILSSSAPQWRGAIIILSNNIKYSDSTGQSKCSRTSNSDKQISDYTKNLSRNEYDISFYGYTKKKKKKKKNGRAIIAMQATRSI